jgi:hypothetical protein
MYRSPPATPTCARHPLAEAVDQCRRCRANVCAPCSIIVGLTICCGRCASIVRDRRIWRLLIWFVFLPEALAAAAVWIVAWPDPRPISRFERLSAWASATPCDVKGDLALPVVSEAYADDPDRTLAILHDRTQDCATRRRMLGEQLARDMRDRDWYAAAQSAEQLLAWSGDPAMPSVLDAMRRGNLDLAEDRVCVLLGTHWNAVAYDLLGGLFRSRGGDQFADRLADWATCTVFNPRCGDPQFWAWDAELPQTRPEWRAWCEDIKDQCWAYAAREPMGCADRPRR